MLIRDTLDVRKRFLATLDRRAFMRSSLAAGALAAVAPPASWAQTTKPAAIPEQIPAVSLDGKAITLARADVASLRASMRGTLLMAQDDGYEAARHIWNPSFERHPALIARCSVPTDVQQAVKFARANQLRTAVRAGGHSLSGQSTCDGGIMIDLQPMKGMRVDAKGMRATAQGGVLLGELDRALQAAGLATTLGTVTDTGIAGLTLGGGMGRLMRKHGLSIDNLVGIDIVTADGRQLHASAAENPDLFWAIRGGGGNFGVATALEYRVHPLAHQVITGSRFYPISQARSIFAAVSEIAASAPDDLEYGVGVVNVPAGEQAGRHAVVGVDYVGEDPAAGQRLLAPLDKLGKPRFDNIKTVSYLEAQGAQGAATLALPNGIKQWVESGFMRDVPAAFIDEMVRRFETVPADLDFGAGLSQMGGAVTRVAPEATAFWNRASQYDLLIGANWIDPKLDELVGKLVREFWDGVKQYTSGYYVNTVPGAVDSRVRGTYGGNYDRLVELKKKFDPANQFRMNANIRPA